MYDWCKEARRQPPRTLDPLPEIRWVRISRSQPCEVCGKPDWCTRSHDGKIAGCMRVENDRPMTNGGWLHILEASENTGVALSPPAVPRSRPPRTLDVHSAFARWTGTTTPQRVDEFARSLGVSSDSLLALGATWADGLDAWAFPMHDARLEPCGIRLRNNDGEKWAVRGSIAGIFMSRPLPRAADTLFICEGPTDTAAMISLGFTAIGRPSCRGSHEHVRRVVQCFDRRPDTVIVADADAAGREGAAALAGDIVQVARSVRIIVPRHGDIRQWLKEGATADDVMQKMSGTRYFRAVN